MKASKDPHYCERVTANDGELGDQALRAFQDNEKTIPTILTTSQKLSTGVDARNVRNIVLLRPVNSMIEFEQIIGRGTRLYDGKDYFTIYDFVKAHHHFSDPEWDGEPPEPEEVIPRTTGGRIEPPEPNNPDGEAQLAEMQKIINAENSDLFDVLAHVAYALQPIPREERAEHARLYIHSRFTSKQQLFLDFVLQHYVTMGVQELAQEKLTPLLRLRYQNSIADAVADLGRPEDIGRLFAGFQRYLCLTIKTSAADELARPLPRDQL
jgi:hypothetical protein